MRPQGRGRPPFTSGLLFIPIVHTCADFGRPILGSQRAQRRAAATELTRTLLPPAQSGSQAKGNGMGAKEFFRTFPCLHSYVYLRSAGACSHADRSFAANPPELLPPKNAQNTQAIECATRQVFHRRKRRKPRKAESFCLLRYLRCLLFNGFSSSVGSVP